MTKIDIYSGFLGAGKTTLIKKMIAEGYCGEKLVLIENEFGEIGIDSGFLQDAGINITEMNSGCICCSLVGDFGKALAQVIEQYHPDRVIIEPSGVGKLSDVIAAVNKVTDADVVLGHTVAVADAGKVKVYMKNFGEFYNNQIEAASTIILSRTDLIAQAKLDAAVELLRAHNQAATIVTTPWDELAGTQLLEAMQGNASLANTMAAMEHEHQHHHEAGHCCHHEEHERHHHHEDGHCCHHEEHERHHHHEDGHCCHHEEHERHHHHEDGHCCHHEEHEHHHHHEEGHCCCHHEEHEHHHHHEDGHCCCHHEEHEYHHHHEEGHCCCHHEEHEHHHHLHDDGHCDCHDHHADEVFTSWGVETAKKFTTETVQQALHALDSQKYGTVLRAKGILPCVDGGWIHFDYVPGEINVRMGSADVIGKLCVIGAQLDEAGVKQLFGV